MKKWMIALGTGFFMFSAAISTGQARNPEQQALNWPHWEPRGFNAGGLFVALAVHPQVPNTVYLGSDVSGVYKSLDAGDTWVSKSVGLESLAIASLVIDPSNYERIWAGTALGLFKSESGGDTWIRLDEGIPGEQISCYILSSFAAIAISQDGQTMLVASHDLATGEDFGNQYDEATLTGKLFRSTDGGTSWAVIPSSRFPLAYQSLSEGTRFPSVMFDPFVPDQAFLLISGYGLLKSTDGGLNWVDFTSGLPADKSDFNWKHLDLGPTQILVSASTFNFDAYPPPMTKIYKSSKVTAAWTSLGSNQGLSYQEGARAVADPLLFSPSSEQTLFLGHEQYTTAPGKLFFKSTDGGSTWVGTDHQVDVNYHYTYALSPFQTWLDLYNASTCMAVDPSNNNRLFTTNWYTVFRSDDAGSEWYEKSVGTQNTVCTDILFSQGRLLSAHMDVILLTTDDLGGVWNASFPVSGTPNIEIISHAWDLELASDGKIYAAISTTDGPRVFRSDDNGNSWQDKSTNLTSLGDPYLDAFNRGALAADPGHANVLFLGLEWNKPAGSPPSTPNSHGVYQTSNFGDTWMRLANQPGSTGNPENMLVKAVEVDPTSSGGNTRLFVGTNWDGLWYSEDSGNSWNKAVGQTVNLSDRSVQEIIAAVDGTVWAAFDDGVYKSTDNGHTFVKSFPDLPHLGEATVEYVTDLIFNPTNTSEMFACTAKQYPVYYNRGSIWRSVNAGQNWTEITGDLQMKRALKLAFKNDYLYVATEGANVFRAYLANTTITPYLDRWQIDSLCSGTQSTVLDFVQIINGTCFR